MATPTVNGTANPQAADRVQVVDEDKIFNPSLNRCIKDWGLFDVGFGYDVVAVFGSQSTGKSTLLNRLFGTTFDVMDESKRQQTTKGIWMCRGKNMNVMVMDVEGTDGRERGEDQDFERKSALFSLASSEVLLINMWEHQVGLYTGANMALLKTVFEVNLGLFGKKDSSSQRTLLLFVIRDHVGHTPLENLQATLTQDLRKIWDSLSKPEGLADRQLTDYFDLSFTTLPHKILMPDKFEDEVTKLRARFVDRTRDDFVFKPAYHKRIPADGVAPYMEGIWEQVQTNKDLDLPTQQELLAQFRCDEIAVGALEEFNTQAKGFRKPIESGNVVEELGKKMRGWYDGALSRFDVAASRYHQGVYKKKRADLIGQFAASLSPLFYGQLKNLHRHSLATFKRDLTEGIRAGGEYDFGVIATNARQKAEESFTTGGQEALGTRVSAEGAKENLDSDWSYEEELGQLKAELGSVADQFRKDETKKMVNHIERKFKKDISEPVEYQLNQAPSNMWDQILSIFQEKLQKAEASYTVKAKSFNCTEDENAQSLYTLRKRAWMALKAKVDEQTADAVILTKLRNHFEERFRYDEKGVPRVWKPEDDIDGAFQKARDKTLELIPQYSKIKPTNADLLFELPPPPPALSSSSSPADDSEEAEFDFESTLQIFSETKQMDITSRFRKDADAYYVEAKRSVVSSVAQIPYWVYGVMVVLGWNEAMAILFNPLYFTALAGLLLASWIIVQLNLAGPLFQVTKTVGGEIQRQAVQRLREQFSEPVAAPPITRTNTTDSYTSSKPLLSRRTTNVSFGDDDEIELKSM